MLEKWIVYRIYKNLLLIQSQVKAEIMSNYIFALKSYHINRYLSPKTFDISCIAIIIICKKTFSKAKNYSLANCNRYLKKNHQQ